MGVHDVGADDVDNDIQVVVSGGKLGHGVFINFTAAFANLWHVTMPEWMPFG